MNIKITAILGTLLILAFIIELLRRRTLREKYAALWLGMGIVAFVVVLFPDTFVAVSHFLGFEVASNLFFVVVVAVLLLISMQFSLELGRSEERSRRLSEEVALHAHAVEQLEERIKHLETRDQ